MVLLEKGPCKVLVKPAAGVLKENVWSFFSVVQLSKNLPKVKTQNTVTISGF